MIQDRSIRIGGHLCRLTIMIVCGAANGAVVASEPTTGGCSSGAALSACAGSNTSRLAQLAPAPPPPAPSGNLLSADRMAAWNPGLMSEGGIPIRTTIYKTLSPSGGDDSAAIQAALNSAPAGQVVMLNPGTFIVNNLLL